MASVPHISREKSFRDISLHVAMVAVNVYQLKGKNDR